MSDSSTIDIVKNIATILSEEPKVDNINVLIQHITTVHSRMDKVTEEVGKKLEEMSFLKQVMIDEKINNNKVNKIKLCCF